MFWVLPAHKLRGIGRPLLERVRRLGDEQGATVRVTWSSIDFAAIASYLKLGLLPGCQIFTFTGALAQPPTTHPEAQRTSLDLAQACAIDHIVRGTPRHVDHAHWQARQIPGFQLHIAGRIAGYFYVNDGVIGPAAWLHAEDGESLLASALHTAAAQAREVKLVAIGDNHTAIRVASTAGLRLVSVAHFLHSAAFGQLDRYIPSGPALF